MRHGAECFNYYFPQDLDDQFLVVWSGYSNPPWRSVGEPELRDFLLARCRDGYSFPLNPVWPIRDPGWYAVLEALKASADGPRLLQAWYPPGSGVLETIERLHKAHPDGFAPLPPPAGSPAAKAATKRKKSLNTTLGAALIAMNLHDVDTREMADFTLAEVRGEVKMRWRRVRNAFIVEARLRRRTASKAPSAGEPPQRPPARLPPINGPPAAPA